MTALPTTKALGDAAEARALDHLSAAGLVLVRRNYRVARGPGSRGGEVDLVMRDRDGTIVLVEVRSRADSRFGGAASIGAAKRRRPIFAASHFLRRLAATPACRFDVVAVDGERIEWLRAARLMERVGPERRAARPPAASHRGSDRRERGGAMKYHPRPCSSNAFSSSSSTAPTSSTPRPRCSPSRSPTL